MNYSHDNLDLLEIRERGQTRHIPRGDYGDTSTALAKPVDVQRIAQDGLNSNVEIVNQVLRQFATTAPAGNRDPQVTGIASPAELASRNERFKWTIVAVIVLSAITALGIVLVAQRVVEIDAFETIAGWLVLSGLGGYASATWVHHRESQLTPEALEMERIKSDYDISSIDAATRQMIGAAFAQSIENDSETKRAYAEAQRAANKSLLERSKPTQAPGRARAMVYDESDLNDWETPQQAPVAPSVATWDDSETEELIVAPTIAPDRDLVNMLAEIDRLYAHCDSRDSDVIMLTLQWGNRGDFSPDAKAKADRVLSYFTRNYDTPLVYRGNENGARWRLNRQAWRRNVARAIIAREWNS